MCVRERMSVGEKIRVCVCMSERETDFACWRDREKKESERVKKIECMCVYERKNECRGKKSSVCVCV